MITKTRLRQTISNYYIIKQHRHISGLSTGVYLTCVNGHQIRLIKARHFCLARCTIAVKDKIFGLKYGQRKNNIGKTLIGRNPLPRGGPRGKALNRELPPKSGDITCMWGAYRMVASVVHPSSKHFQRTSSVKLLGQFHLNLNLKGEKEV